MSVIPGQTLSIQTPKKRKVRFTDQEVRVLVDTIWEHMGELFGPKPSNVVGKAAIWDTVVERVNKEGKLNRTLPECKKRWHDYKRKVKNVIDTAKLQASDGNMSMEDIPKRQMNIAKFFKWDTEGTTSSPLPNSFLNIDISCDAEDDFIQKQDMSSSSYLMVDSPEDVCVTQSSADVAKQPAEHHKANASRKPIHSSAGVSKQTSEHHEATPSKDSIEPTSTEHSQQQLPSWESKLDQLIAQQQQTNNMLKIVQESVSQSLKLQKRMSNMIKTNFIELQKSIMSNQKTSSEQSGALEHTMKSLSNQMNEINNHLRVKKLQEFMCSDDESDLETGTPQMLSTPLTNTPTPGKKRGLNQTPSSSGLPKKKGRKIDLQLIKKESV